MEFDPNDMFQALANQRDAYANESAKFCALLQKALRENAALIEELANEKAKHEVTREVTSDPPDPAV